MMNLNRERHQRAFVLLHELAERQLGNGILASPSPRVGETGEGYPGKSCTVEARVVFVSRPERAITVSCFVNSARGAFHKLCITLRIIEVDECKGLIRQNQSGSAVDYVMDQHFALTQAVTERLNLICCSQCEIVVRQPNTGAFTFTKFAE